MLAIRFLTGRRFELGLEPTQGVLLVLTLVVCMIHFGGRRTTVLHGAVHLVLFVAYLILMFDR